METATAEISFWQYQLPICHVDLLRSQPVTRVPIRAFNFSFPDRHICSRCPTRETLKLVYWHSATSIFRRGLAKATPYFPHDSLLLSFCCVVSVKIRVNEGVTYLCCWDKMLLRFLQCCSLDQKLRHWSCDFSKSRFSVRLADLPLVTWEGLLSSISFRNSRHFNPSIMSYFYILARLRQALFKYKYMLLWSYKLDGDVHKCNAL